MDADVGSDIIFLKKKKIGMLTAEKAKADRGRWMAVRRRFLRPPGFNSTDTN